jgi:hypothetical protein
MVGLPRSALLSCSLGRWSWLPLAVPRGTRSSRAPPPRLGVPLRVASVRPRPLAPSRHRALAAPGPPGGVAPSESPHSLARGLPATAAVAGCPCRGPAEPEPHRDGHRARGCPASPEAGDSEVKARAGLGFQAPAARSLPEPAALFKLLFFGEHLYRLGSRLRGIRPTVTELIPRYRAGSFKLVVCG